jgi:hypothetical protein
VPQRILGCDAEHRASGWKTQDWDDTDAGFEVLIALTVPIAVLR